MGSKDCTQEWWSAFSNLYPIEAGKTLHLEFTNHTTTTTTSYKAWFNYSVALSNSSEGHSADSANPFYKEGYSEYAVVRADNYGWGDCYNALGNSTNCSYTNAIMNGAYVALDIARQGPTVAINATINGADGNAYYQKYFIDIQENSKTIYACLTVDHAYIEIDNDKTSTTVTPTEAAGSFVYTNDFSSKDGLTQVGSGEFIADDTFGYAYKNTASTDATARTNYLVMPSDLLSHSVTSEALTVGFWVKTSGSYKWSSPIFNAYNAAPKDGENTSPMFNCVWRGLLQANCGRGWTDYTDDQNKAGSNTQYDGAEGHAANWLGDGKWHYYTVVLDGDNAKVYFDGVVKNEWDMDGKVNTQKGVFYTGSYLKYICLGGNQAWNWGDMDPGFSYAKFRVQNNAMTQEDILAQMKQDKTVSATMGANGYATFGSPCKLDLSNLPDGLTAYKGKVSGTNVNFSSVDVAVPAHTGLLLKGDNDETYTIPVAESASPLAGNDLKVNAEGNTFPGDTGYTYYGMLKPTSSSAALTFGVFDPSTVAIPANKAYLKVKDADTGARELTVTFGEEGSESETTGINAVSSEKANNDYYNLAGQRVAAPTKGLYIVNGKKYVVK